MAWNHSPLDYSDSRPLNHSSSFQPPRCVTVMNAVVTHGSGSRKLWCLSMHVEMTRPELLMSCVLGIQAEEIYKLSVITSDFRFTRQTCVKEKTRNRFVKQHVLLSSQTQSQRTHTLGRPAAAMNFVVHKAETLFYWPERKKYPCVAGRVLLFCRRANKMKPQNL